MYNKINLPTKEKVDAYNKLADVASIIIKRIIPILKKYENKKIVRVDGHLTKKFSDEINSILKIYNENNILFIAFYNYAIILSCEIRYSVKEEEFPETLRKRVALGNLDMDNKFVMTNFEDDNFWFNNKIDYDELSEKIKKYNEIIDEYTNKINNIYSEIPYDFK